MHISRSYLNKKQYTFDAVFNESADTPAIYHAVIHPLVQRVCDGYSAGTQFTSLKPYTLVA